MLIDVIVPDEHRFYGPNFVIPLMKEGDRFEFGDLIFEIKNENNTYKVNAAFSGSLLRIIRSNINNIYHKDEIIAVVSTNDDIKKSDIRNPFFRINNSNKGEADKIHIDDEKIKNRGKIFNNKQDSTR